MFRQADGSSTRRHGGLGLGLAIARRIIEMHGGSISATSEGKGHGATFTVSIPVASVGRAALAPTIHSIEIASAVAASAESEVPDLSGIRVLAVDDEQDAREMVRAVLEQFNADVMIVGSAEEALEAFPGWKPDVLVCDIGMPAEDGLALIRKVRKLEGELATSTPATALTGYARVEDRKRALDAGYQSFVTKPVEANELATAIASLVGRMNGTPPVKKDAAGDSRS